jgi:hypothetical protein
MYGGSRVLTPTRRPPRIFHILSDAQTCVHGLLLHLIQLLALGRFMPNAN